MTPYGNDARRGILLANLLGPTAELVYQDGVTRRCRIRQHERLVVELVEPPPGILLRFRMGLLEFDGPFTITSGNVMIGFSDVYVCP